ncbi:MAG: LysE family translocator [Sphingomonadales bacterium]
MTTINAYGPGILIALATYAVATISPGPAVLGTLGAAVGDGRRAGAAIAAGICCGSLTWGILAAFGLSAMLVSQPEAVGTIRVAGTGYLLFLAWKAFRSATISRALKIESVGRRTLSGHFLRGWGIQLANPTAVFAWIAMISLGVKPGAPPWVPALVLLGALAFALPFYTLLAVVFSTPRIVQLYSKGRRGIDTLLSAFFAFAAWKLAVG